MRVVVFLSVFAFAFAAQSFGQVDTECPEIKVLGPSRIVMPGDKAVFVASITPVQHDAVLQWTVQVGDREGSIESGQGTAKVVVSTTRNDEGEEIKARVVITGLPSDCPNFASATVRIDQLITWGHPDEFGDIDPNDMRERLDSFFVELHNNPTHSAFIEVYIDRKERSDLRNKRIRLFIEHIKYRNMDLTRFQFGVTRLGFRSIRLWRIPPGEENPSCDGCVLINGKDLK